MSYTSNLTTIKGNAERNQRIKTIHFGYNIHKSNRDLNLGCFSVQSYW